MQPLICHLLGDFVFQNQSMANRKRQSYFWCGFHCLVYGSMFILPSLLLPSLFFFPSVSQLLFITSTHFIIDRWSLAAEWCKFYGVGVNDATLPGLLIDVEDDLRNGLGIPLRDITFFPDPPQYISDICRLAVDQSFHLTLNYFAFAFLT